MADVTYLFDRLKEELFMLGSRQPIRGGWTGDPDNASGRPTISAIAQFNRVQDDLLLLTNCFFASGPVTVVASTQEYTLPTDLHKIISISHAGIRLRRTYISELDRREPRWRNLVTGTPRRYARNLKTKFLTIPAPNAAAVTADSTFDFIYTKPATTLATSGQVPDLDIAFHYLYATGAALRIADMDRGNTYNSERFPYLQEEWKTGVALLADHIIKEYGIIEDYEDAPTETGK